MEMIQSKTFREVLNFLILLAPTNKGLSEIVTISYSFLFRLSFRFSFVMKQC
jgi:hypothetical protein